MNLIVGWVLMRVNLIGIEPKDISLVAKPRNLTKARKEINAI